MYKWLEKLWKDLQKWWRKLNKKRLGPVTNVTSEIDMAKTVTLTWELPVERESGGPATIDDISAVIVEMSADGNATWTEINVLLPTDPQTVSVPDLEPGEWGFRIICVDADDRPGLPYIHVETVVDDSPLMPVTNVVATQT